MRTDGVVRGLRDRGRGRRRSQRGGGLPDVDVGRLTGQLAGSDCGEGKALRGDVQRACRGKGLEHDGHPLLRAVPVIADRQRTVRLPSAR
ncbi:hypothetical protein WR25_16700 [Diploscapter pachys]|uniref:Uncharacterized protein n=1 Tax=Diploscapter pachys TaxID=2018661 RepID=A0A2A2LTW4_9BILA|nr:hypothetical protein WR25_16700 [Diploscapter pachys]